MAKRYYWLKLKEDFYDDDTIQYIEEQENGVYYSNFYMKLCLKSLKSEGKLMRLVGDTLIPYDTKSLSKLTGVPVDTVRVAMTLFERIGLVKILDTGELYLTQMEEMIGSETDKAQIMRRKRAKEKLVSNNVTTTLPKCYIEKEIEKEKELYIDRECAEFAPPSSQQVKEYCIEKGYNIDPDRFVDFYTSKDWMIGTNKMKDWKATVRTWNSRNKENEERQIKQKNSDNKFHNFEQRQYDYQELERRLNEKATKNF